MLQFHAKPTLRDRRGLTNDPSNAIRWRPTLIRVKNWFVQPFVLAPLIATGILAALPSEELRNR